MHSFRLSALAHFTIAVASLVGCAPASDTQEDAAISQLAVTRCAVAHCIPNTLDFNKPLVATTHLNVDGTPMPSKLTWEPGTATREGSSYRFRGTVSVGGPASAIPALTFNVEAIASSDGRISVWGTDGNLYGLAAPGPDMQSSEPGSLLAIFNSDGHFDDEAETWQVEMQIKLTGRATSNGFEAKGSLNFFDEPILFLDGHDIIGFDEPILFFDPMTFDVPPAGS